MLIDNLQADCCVEVPCVASASGIEPQPVGALPALVDDLLEAHGDWVPKLEPAARAAA